MLIFPETTRYYLSRKMLKEKLEGGMTYERKRFI